MQYDVSPQTPRSQPAIEHNLLQWQQVLPYHPETLSHQVREKSTRSSKYTEISELYANHEIPLKYMSIYEIR